MVIPDFELKHLWANTLLVKGFVCEEIEFRVFINSDNRRFENVWWLLIFFQEELDDILRYGSKELFADENDEAGKSRQIHYDDTAIDRYNCKIKQMYVRNL